MIRILSRWLIVGAASLFFLGGSPGFAAESRPSLFPQDDRLARRVSVQKWRVYLGEFLEELSDRSQVPLSVDTGKAPLDGIELSVCLRNQPVRDVMGALVGLLEQKANRWEWQPNRDRTRYTLRCQRSPLEAGTAARQALMGEWAKDVREFYTTARLPEPTRSERAALRPDLFPRGMIESGRADVVAALAADEVEAVLRGVRVTFDPQRISPAQRRALSLGVSSENPIGEKQPAFYMRWDADEPSPILWLQNGNGTSGNVVGGGRWDRLWTRRELPGWTTQYSDDVFEYYKRRQQEVPGPGIGRPLSGDALTVFEWLQRLAEAQPLNFIADPVVPAGSSTFGGAWVGSTTEQSLQALVFAVGLMTKPHGEIHLLRHRSAGMNPRAGLVSWSLVRKLRETAARNHGYLDLATLTELSRLSEPQLTGLAEEFPSADYGRLRPFRALFRFHDELTPAMQARLKSPEGLPFRDAGVVARAALAEDPDPRNLRELELLAARGAEARVALRLETRERASPRVPEAPPQQVPAVIWEVRLPNEKPIRHGFLLSPRKPLRPQ